MLNKRQEPYLSPTSRTPSSTGAPHQLLAHSQQPPKLLLCMRITGKGHKHSHQCLTQCLMLRNHSLTAHKRAKHHRHPKTLETHQQITTGYAIARKHASLYLSNPQAVLVECMPASTAGIRGEGWCMIGIQEKQMKTGQGGHREHCRDGAKAETTVQPTWTPSRGKCRYVGFDARRMPRQSYAETNFMRPN